MDKNFIIHQSAKQYQWSGECRLSIKSFYRGMANYTIGHREYKVNQTNFLILNECTNYDLTIDTKVETESFCVFFSPDFVSNVVSESFSSERQLLDLNPVKKDSLHFLERKFSHEGLISNLLLNGKNQLSYSDSKLEYEEFYHQLLEAIILKNSEALFEAKRLDSRKKSTRVEIYQRIYCAKDFIDAYYKTDLSLSDIAGVAALSDNHLLRCFKQVFGISPFKYISILRIQEACKQIRNSDKTISEIAMDLGYSSMSNFSHYFKTIMGVSPIHYKLGDI